jgi:hypothetical protein
MHISARLKTPTSQEAAYEAARFGVEVGQAACTEFEKLAASGVVSPLAAFKYPHLVKIAAQAEAAAPQAGAMEAESPGEVERISPVHEMLGIRSEVTKDGAKGIPVLAPPPGYVYDPILRAQAPNLQDPGWAAREEAPLRRADVVGQEQAQQGAMEQAVAQQQAAAQAGASAQPGAPAKPQGAKPPAVATPATKPPTPPGIAGTLPQ